MPIKVFDFFSGCGGTSAGLRAAGLDIVLAIDNDEEAQQTFEANFPEATFLRTDVCTLNVADIAPIVDANRTDPILFSGCAPCQPFTKQNTNRREEDDRTLLLCEFGRFVQHFLPQYVFIENVPGMQNVGNEDGPFCEFNTLLDALGYHIVFAVIESQDYGVPQRRSRLVLLASLLGPIGIPQKTHGPGTPHPRYSTVHEWIGDLPPLAAGEESATVPNHRAAGLSALNLQRIMATPEGGGRLDWPRELHLRCHSNGYTGHTDVYGRMAWRQPATGLTTRCISLSNGRFGHPQQHRAISIREAACLQTFARDFIFHGNMASMAKQIGNAVPVLLAQRIGELFHTHYEFHRDRAI